MKNFDALVEQFAQYHNIDVERAKMELIRLGLCLVGGGTVFPFVNGDISDFHTCAIGTKLTRRSDESLCFEDAANVDYMVTKDWPRQECVEKPAEVVKTATYKEYLEMATRLATEGQPFTFQELATTLGLDPSCNRKWTGPMVLNLRKKFDVSVSRVVKTHRTVTFQCAPAQNKE